MPHIVFNNIECIFRKTFAFSYLIFCESDKNEKMVNNYVKVIDRVKEEIFYFKNDEEDDEIFIVGSDFMRFNTPVCVISISRVVNKGNWYYFQTKLQECFYENDYF